MSNKSGEPLVWLMFSAGGVMAALFLPVLAFLFALAIPLGWVDVPSYGHLRHILATPVAFVGLLGSFVLMLVHSAHRFRYTLYDGLQIKFRRTVAACCYGGAVVGSVAAFVVLRSVA
ncbi:MAG: fumarate reductase subunit D [Actinobacteria bacterium]|nr:fumarate reductase subunit D [Actinomycetota bacterium]